MTARLFREGTPMAPPGRRAPPRPSIRWREPRTVLFLLGLHSVPSEATPHLWMDVVEPNLRPEPPPTRHEPQYPVWSTSQRVLAAAAAGRPLGLKGSGREGLATPA